MPSQCLNSAVVDRSYYLAPASFADVIEEVIAHCKLGRDDLLFRRRSLKNTPRDICIFLAKKRGSMHENTSHI